MVKEGCSHLGGFENKEHHGHVHILLKGEHLLSLNKTPSSPPTPVLVIKIFWLTRGNCQLKSSLALDIFTLLVGQRVRTSPH